MTAASSSGAPARAGRASGIAVAAVGAVAADSLLFTLVGVPVGVATLDQYGPTGVVFIVIFPAIVLSLTLVGGFVALRVPGNPVGWLLEAAGACAAMGIFGGAYVNYAHATSSSLPLVVPIAWLSGWGVLSAIAMLVIFVPLLFPTGRFLGPRWRRFGLAGVVGAVASALGPAFTPGPLPETPWIDNPLGIPGTTGLLAALTVASNLVVPIFFGGAVVGVFVRYRRADRLERQQLKWFGLVASVAVVAFGVSIPNNGPVSDVAWQVGLTTLPLLPVAIGVAILRYRLWDIDRVISRTLGWGLLTGLLAGAFALAVVTLEDLLAGVTQGETLAVAGSTLLTAALFGPLRGRVQRAVDHKFDRARYDDERVVALFGERLRSNTDPNAVEREIRDTVLDALRPGTAVVWVRGVRPR